MSEPKMMLIKNMKILGPAKIFNENFVSERGYRTGTPGEERKSTPTWRTDPTITARRCATPSAIHVVMKIGRKENTIKTIRKAKIPVITLPGRLCVNPPCVNM
jgi:hypothetical protein